jgi:hypothetical protein
MTAWSHLPNALHIDAVIANLGSFSIRSMPTEHVVQKVAQNAAWRAAQDGVQEVSQDAAWCAARRAVYSALVLTVTGDVAWNAALDVAWDAAQDVIIALIAYDHSAQYLTMTADELAVWSKLSTEPAAILLLPYVTLMEPATSKETA